MIIPDLGHVIVLHQDIGDDLSSSSIPQVVERYVSTGEGNSISDRMITVFCNFANLFGAFPSRGGTAVAKLSIASPFQSETSLRQAVHFPSFQQMARASKSLGFCGGFLLVCFLCSHTNLYTRVICCCVSVLLSHNTPTTLGLFFS